MMPFIVRRTSVLDPNAQNEDVESDSETGSSSGSEEADDDIEEENEEETEDTKRKKRFEEIKRIFDEIKQAFQGNSLNLTSEEEIKKFKEQYKDDLGEVTAEDDDDHNTLLHMLVEDATDKDFEKYEPLVRLLVEDHPDLLKVKDNSDKTSLYNAVSKKRNKLVKFICETYSTIPSHPNINSILEVKCYKSENCLHVAIHKNVIPSLTCFLIQKSSKDVLCAQDDQGNTPLHLAIEYKRCTDEQYGIVEMLIKQCPEAMKKRTNDPQGFSPYRYHEYTRAKAKKAEAGAKAAEARKTVAVKPVAANEKDGEKGKYEGSMNGVETSTGKEPKDGKLKPPISAKNKKEPMGEKNEEGKHAGRMGQVPTKKYEGADKVSSTPVGGNKSPWPAVSSVDGKDVPEEAAVAEGTKSIDKKDSAKTGVVKKTKKKCAHKDKKDEKGKKNGKKGKKEVTDKSADAIKDYLKMHCMRTMKHEDAVDFLYGRNQEKQIYFDLCDYLSLTISKEHIEDGLAHLKFEDVLQYVAFPNLKIEKKTTLSKIKKPMRPDGDGRSDMVFLFSFLRKKKVGRIIRVIVDDRGDGPAHSDEMVEKALGSLGVEIWDWQKFDLCAETIWTAAPKAREVHLYWSGNNAVLQGWCDPSEQGGGLKRLKELETVHLHVEQGLETIKRTQENVTKFIKRLNVICPKVMVKPDYEHQSGKHELTGGPVNSAHDQVAHRHKWLICMDEFADFVQNVKVPNIKTLSDGELYEPVTIALIDDGVDMKEKSLHGKIVGGMSFCPRDEAQNLNKPYYVTGGGHGTAMASLICRVCPKAKLYILKLEEHIGPNNKRQLTALSAAKAVKAAIDKKVHIISMSWTIEKKDNENTAGIIALETAIQDAAEEGILMFCAASDEGIASDKCLPAAGREKNLFKIGAATEEGSVWKWVWNLDDVDFIFPGHKVVKERYNEASLEDCKTLTGSSVATAIAAGLAGLVLYCVQLAAMDNEDLDQQQKAQASNQLNPQDQRAGSVTMEDFKALKKHERMKQAFQQIGTNRQSEDKYVEVWNVFEGAAARASTKEGERKVDIITDIATRLKMTKNIAFR